MACLRILAILACVSIMLPSSGCEKSSAQVVTSGEGGLSVPLNTPVVVTLRNDMLRAPITIAGEVNTGTTVTGTITAVSNEWFVVSTTGQDIWIARDLVAIIQAAR
ncbi:MAG: hypothetical protein A2Y07_07380 [Planctomycetes bacterium GWF2_50_10]|nr:MAG: hypothetical protein A2Y07_07380 [Planctomycetes bacterium GWF2_50_10]